MTGSHDDEIVHDELDKDRNEPAVQIVEVVASLEETDQDELKPIYDQIDHVLSHIFSNPPDEEAQIEITFTYENYRVTVEQNGAARFVRTS
jgi:hypothetical protein